MIPITYQHSLIFFRFTFYTKYTKTRMFLGTMRKNHAVSQDLEIGCPFGASKFLRGSGTTIYSEVLGFAAKKRLDQSLKLPSD